MRTPRGGFFAGSLRASLPLWVWAAHFVVSYVGVSIGCSLGWHEGSVAGLSPLRWGLAMASVLALAAVAGMAWSARRSTQASPGLQDRAHRLMAWLALLGIAWASVPPLVLPTCHFT